MASLSQSDSQPTTLSIIRNGTTINSEVNLEEVKWSDIFEDENGVPTGVLGQQWSSFSSKQLRTICSRLSIKGVKNAKKSDMVDALIAAYKNKQLYAAMQNRREDDESGEKTRKQAQCPFRLLNILFSDEFADAFSRLGDIATRQVLDTGKAGNDQHFWQGVQKTFIENDKKFGKLQFLDDHVFADCEIDPSIIVKHDWKKLRAIWKKTNSEYKAALTRFTMSGTHANDFYSFCNGKIDVYYLYKHLQQRPSLNDMVAADLPKECSLSSTMAREDIQKRLFENISPTSLTTFSSNDKSPDTVSSKRKKTKNGPGAADVAEAIREFSNSQMRSELASKRLHYMAREDARSQHKTQFQEWERLVSNIRTLRQELRDQSLTTEDREEIEDDIKGLKRRKAELSVELGFKKE